MQRIYAINFFAGVAFAGGFAGTAALSLLALVEVSTDAVIYASMGSLAIFLPVNLLIWRLNRVRTQTSLEFPVPHRVFGRVSGTLVALIVVSLVYCVFAWPAAPIRPSASGNVDKRGQRFTESAYLGFRRWEASYVAVWRAAAFCSCSKDSSASSGPLPATRNWTIRDTVGATCLSRSNCFIITSVCWMERPVILPPGRERLVTIPSRTGSPAVAKTMGIVAVACFAARGPAVPWVTIKSTLRRTRSAARLGRRPNRPSAQRYSIKRFTPSWYPALRSPCLSAAIWLE